MCPSCAMFKRSTRLRCTGETIGPDYFDLPIAYVLGVMCEGCSWRGRLFLLATRGPSLVEMNLVKGRMEEEIPPDPSLSWTPACPGCQIGALSFTSEEDGNHWPIRGVFHHFVECSGAFGPRGAYNANGEPLEPTQGSCGWVGTLTLRTMADIGIGFHIGKAGDLWLAELTKKVLLGETWWVRLKNRMRQR